MMAALSLGLPLRKQLAPNVLFISTARFDKQTKTSGFRYHTGHYVEMSEHRVLSPLGVHDVLESNDHRVYPN